MQPVDTFTHCGIECRIYQHDDAGNPYQEYDQASKLLLGPALARDYDWGETFWRFEDAFSVAVAARYLRLMEGYALAVPFAFHDYGSGGMQARLVSEHHDRAAGFAVMTWETVREEWGDAPDAIEKARACLRGEFKTFAQWLEGDVYGYVVADGSPEEDSCWGFYGHDGQDGIEGADDAWTEARSAAEYAAERRAERIRQERVYLLDPVAIDRDAYYSREGVTT